MPPHLPPGLTEQSVANLAQRSKTILRQRMRATRKATPSSVLEAKSAQIVQNLRQLDWVRDANGIGLFWPIVGRGEVDLRSLDVALRRDGKRVFYPFMRPQDVEHRADARQETAPARESAGETSYTTGFARVDDTSRLEDYGRGFLEPPRGTPLAERGQLDVICVPALAASAALFRMGYGAGYYDVTLPDYCPPARSIITIFDFQLLAELPIEPHDVPCDAVLSEARLIRQEPGPS